MRVKLGTKEQDDNRTSTRIKSRFPVMVIAPSGELYDAKTVDLSEQGLLLEFMHRPQNEQKILTPVEDTIKKGSVISVKLNSPFLAPEQSGNKISYRVIREIKLPNGRYRIALEILSNGIEGNNNFNIINPDEYVIPSAMEAEFLKILEQMNLQLPEQRSRVIVLSGVDANVGTSTISWWLASCISRLINTRVLYVDANLRPAISLNSEEASRGLLEVLLEQQTLDETVIDMGPLSPMLLNSGGEDGFLGNEITESQVAARLKEMRDKYRYIFIDSLPVNSSPLTAMLAKQADGTFLVLDSGETERKMAQMATERLRQSGAKIIGVIINKL